MQGLAHDLRLAVRLLARDRRFTVAAVVALGLGIGLNTSVFALINAALIRDAPFEDGDRLMAIRSRDARAEESGVSHPDFQDLRRLTTAFSGISADAGGTMNISEEGRAPERLRGSYISANTLRLLRTAPVIGRDLLPEDDRPGAPAVAILGYGVWQSRYGGDASVLGRTIRVNEVPATIVGVMPAGFRYPFIAEIWQPLSARPGIGEARRDARSLGVVGRLRDSIEPAQAQAELRAIAAQLAQTHAATNANISIVVKPLKEQRFAPRDTLVTMMGAVAFVLLIAYANLANLLLARAADRSRDIAIRASLGATQWQLVRQLLVECGVVAALGGALGFALSIYGVNEIAVGFDIIEPGAQPGSTRPYWLDVSPNALVYVFVGVLSLLSALAFGLLPAWHVSRTNTHDMLKEGGRGSGGAVRARRWGAALLVAEVALTLMLLTGAGLIWRTFVSRYRTDLVVGTSNVVTMRLMLPPQKYPTAGDRKRFFERLDERLAGIPVLSSVTMASHPPFDFGGPPREILVDGITIAAGEKPPAASYVVTGTRYFETLALAIVRGRGLTEADSRTGQEGAVVDQRFAARFFPDSDPIGRRIRAGAAGPWFTIVGVAPTVPQFGPAQFSRPVVYAPLGAEPAPEPRGAVMVKGSLAAVTPVLREVVRELDSNLPLFAIETLDTAVARSRFPTRLVGTWFGVLALIALVLASVGVFALTSHAVARRTQEIGVRMALGAQAPQVVWLFVRRTLVQLAMGLALGLAGAMAAGRLLQTFIDQTSPRDPVTLVIVTSLLVLVAGVATLLPARRAARVDPMVALRAE